MRGADGFVGFIPDLMRRLSDLVGFNYEIRLVRDGKYGSVMEDGNWNGMIGELVRRVSICYCYRAIHCKARYCDCLLYTSPSPRD